MKELFKDKNTYVVKTMFGLEPILEEELKKIGATEITRLKRGVSCEGDAQFIFKANYELRTALRILMNLFDEEIKNENELYNAIYDYPWEQFITSEDTIAVDAVTYSEIFRHSHFVALKTKDAIVDRLRTLKGERPSVNTVSPNYKIHVHIQHNKLAVSIDTSGESLHKRGYRATSSVATISEVLAAGMILMSGWEGNSTFVDPMCGSGTIAIEAALYALNLPPQWKRMDFSFMKWKGFDKNAWKAYTQERLNESKKELDFKIYASDVSHSVVRAAKYNFIGAGVDRFVELTECDINDHPEMEEIGYLLTNPPYEERIVTGEINVLYKSIGDAFKKKFTGYRAFLISSNIEATKHIGLKAFMKKELMNADLPCKFLGYELYKGTKT